MNLEIQRQETSQVIADLLQNTFFRRYWRAIGTFIGRGKVASIWVSAAVVMLINFLLGSGISLLLGETHYTGPQIILTNLMWVTYTYFMILLFLAVSLRLIEFIRVRLLESLQDEQHIHHLQVWAKQWLGRISLQLLFSLGYALIVATAGFYSVYQTTQFSLGVTFIYFMNFFHLAVGLYGGISIIAFLLRLHNWSLRLYPDDPASSPILMQLSEELRNYIVTYSFAISLIMLLMSLVGGLNIVGMVVILILSWTPTLTLFILGHYVFSRLIKRLKHERLGNLQSKIMKLSNADELDTKKNGPDHEFDGLS